MKIPVQKLLAKIEDELRMAKGSVKVEDLREKVYSIKILCELILDEQQAKGERTGASSEQMSLPPSDSVNQLRKLEMNDGANGNSLFDF